MKRKLFLTLGLAALTMYSYGAKKPKTTARKMNKTTVQQPTFTEWHDLQVNEINRLPLHTSFFTYPFDDMVYEEGGVVKSRNLSSVDKTMSQNFLSLDGIWKFKWVENADQRPTDFYLTNLDDSHWGTIPVPGNWELNGYGQPEYVNIGFAWRGHFDEQPPAVPVKDNHVGSYRRQIDIPANWDGKQVIAHFGSVTSNIYLLIGTQMISKGLDFDKVRVVGILNADSMLNYPDFRAYEHAFMMMSQVSGRAGRKGKRGLVILQTKSPELPVISQVVHNDYAGFY